MLRAGGVSIITRSHPASSARSSIFGSSISLKNLTAGQLLGPPFSPLQHGLLSVHIEHKHIVADLAGRNCKRARQGGFPNATFLHSDSDDFHVHF